MFSEAEEEYIEAHSEAEPEELRRLNRRVQLELPYPHMCSGHLQGRVLKMLTRMVAPRRVLEVGTYAGYSALCIAEGLADDSCEVHTVEIDDELEPFIRRALAASPYGGRVTLHIGDVAALLPGIATGEMFDMAYLDANKRTYTATYEAVLPRIRPGGFILADNTLWGGKAAAPSAHADPQTAGIRSFNDLVARDPRVEAVILPLRDGLTLIRKKRD